MTDLGRLQSVLAETRMYLASEREKHTDLSGRVKNREKLVARLEKQIMDENMESDYLVTKNGQIA